MTVLLLTIAYVAVVLFLLLLSLRASYRWYLKAGIIVICSLFYAVIWNTLPKLEGWPIERALPDEFQLISQHIVQPDKYKGTKGAIYMWVIDLGQDADRRPRAYKLPYVEELHEDIVEATSSGEIQKGKKVQQTGDNIEGSPSSSIKFQPMPVNRPPPKD